MTFEQGCYWVYPSGWPLLLRHLLGVRYKRHGHSGKKLRCSHQTSIPSGRIFKMVYYFAPLHHFDKSRFSILALCHPIIMTTYFKARVESKNKLQNIKIGPFLLLRERESQDFVFPLISFNNLIFTEI